MRETPSTVMALRDTGQSKEILRASGIVGQIERRLFLKQGLSLGALTLLTGCDITDTSAVQSALNDISRWNDRIQALIFNPRRLMPTYPEVRRSRTFVTTPISVRAKSPRSTARPTSSICPAWSAAGRLGRCQSSISCHRSRK
jgi:hypothetical protein